MPQTGEQAVDPNFPAFHARHETRHRAFHLLTTLLALDFLGLPLLTRGHRPHELRPLPLADGFDVGLGNAVKSLVA
jgi:hypothetical protein